MKKYSSNKNRQSKDVVMVIFLFSIIVGIVLTTYIANNALGQNTPITQAAGPQP